MTDLADIFDVKSEVANVRKESADKVREEREIKAAEQKFAHAKHAAKPTAEEERPVEVSTPEESFEQGEQQVVGGEQTAVVSNEDVVGASNVPDDVGVVDEPFDDGYEDDSEEDEPVYDGDGVSEDAIEDEIPEEAFVEDDVSEEESVGDDSEDEVEDRQPDPEMELGGNVGYGEAQSNKAKKDLEDDQEYLDAKRAEFAESAKQQIANQKAKSKKLSNKKSGNRIVPTGSSSVPKGPDAQAKMPRVMYNAIVASFAKCFEMSGAERLGAPTVRDYITAYVAWKTEGVGLSELSTTARALYDFRVKLDLQERSTEDKILNEIKLMKRHVMAAEKVTEANYLMQTWMFGDRRGMPVGNMKDGVKPSTDEVWIDTAMEYFQDKSNEKKKIRDRKVGTPKRQ